MTALAFVDCETTGLDPDRHEVWEVALRLRVLPDEDGKAPADEVRHWMLPVDLSKADPVALTIGGYYERCTVDPEVPYLHAAVSPDPLASFAQEFARLTHGAHLVAACPAFDAAFLSRLLRKNGACPGWHYHLVDVEALAAGALGLEPPWDSDNLNERLGIAVEGKHTAEGDVAWSVAMYDAALARRARPSERLSGPATDDRSRFRRYVDDWGMFGTVLEACVIVGNRAHDEERKFYSDAPAVLRSALDYVERDLDFDAEPKGPKPHGS